MNIKHTTEKEAGVKYGRLTVIKVLDTVTKHQKTIFRCICDCGKEIDVVGTYVKNGITKSCGCFKIDGIRKLSYVHGKVKTPEYNIWCLMKRRCLNPTSASYSYYGGRGITVCDIWKNSFEKFLADMGERPTSKHSIDRIENNGNYEPSNCRWATKKEQAQNKNSNKPVCIDNMLFKTQSDFIKYLGIRKSQFDHRRYQSKLSIEQIYKQFKKQ